ncbi:MAG: thioredoxin family protein [Paludibacteraceae bacterium]|nr:thioredoxin family protein [Paludibacteraceae bacterium]
MKNILGLILLLVSCLSVHGEIVQPVTWSQKQYDEGESVVLELSAAIQNGWHVYGMNIPEGGPLPMEVVITEIRGGSKRGGVRVIGEEIVQQDETFGMELSWYEKKLKLIQRIAPGEERDWSVCGYVRYMCCDDQSCLPPEKKKFEFTGRVDKKEASGIVVSGETHRDTLKEEKSVGGTETSAKEDWWSATTWTGSETDETGERASHRSLWLLFLSGIVGGLLALLTPCVWPILPMTVGFFLKRGARNGVRDAILYALSIVIIYVGLGLAVSFLFGADSLNVLATNAWVNIFFFVLFVVFALSFFGLFEIRLPGGWSTALNRRAEKTGGFLSIILLAMVLVIVSFSCTGPIVGTLLVEAATATSTSVLTPLVGMLGFSLALSLPFGLCALFPGFLKRLPKSGGWMETVKVILALVELAMALKFLSVADLVMGWGILPRWLFIAAWAVLGFVLALYVLLKGQMSRKLNYLFAMAGIVFGIYMLSGWFGNRLKAVSAFLPPESVAEVWTDYEEGMTEAKKRGVPVFVDFTGWGCVNCRKMEAAVLEAPEVKEILDKMVVIRLYVDDRQPLDRKEMVKENGGWAELETIGEWWSWLERSKFGANAQPLYVVLDNAGKMTGPMRGYDEDLQQFCVWLETCVKRYEATKEEK